MLLLLFLLFFLFFLQLQSGANGHEQRGVWSEWNSKQLAAWDMDLAFRKALAYLGTAVAQAQSEDKLSVMLICFPWYQQLPEGCTAAVHALLPWGTLWHLCAAGSPFLVMTETTWREHLPVTQKLSMKQTPCKFFQPQQLFEAEVWSDTSVLFRECGLAGEAACYTVLCSALSPCRSEGLSRPFPQQGECPSSLLFYSGGTLSLPCPHLLLLPLRACIAWLHLGVLPINIFIAVSRLWGIIWPNGFIHLLL